MKNKIFIPDQYVPVSEFFSPGAEMIIPATLLGFIRERQDQLRVAHWDGFAAQLLKPDRLDLNRGVAVVTGKDSGVFVMVLENLKNDFPVVTHWCKDMNGGKGGFCEGATDGIGTLDIDGESGRVINEKSIHDQDVLSPYTFLWDRYMLFSNGKETENAKVPAYERYLGENYSFFKVSDMLALWLSNKALEGLGYPLVFKNYPGFELLEGVPAFQVVNNLIIAKDADKPSLATFILPPYWRADSKKAYPIAFSGYYDNNGNMFQTVGPSLLEMLGNVIKETGEPAMGIIWNGGASTGARTFQHSAFHNLTLLFHTAAQKFRGDTDNIVAVGGSRGGISALAAAGNPWAENYRIKYAVCYNPVVRFGEEEWDMPNPTCPLIYAAMSEDTGYKLAWMRNWRDPVHGWSGQALFLNNLFGTCDRSIINELLCPGSQPFAKSIAEKGTKVFLAAGTHDAFTTKDFLIDFAELLKKHGAQVHLQLGYRFGHNNATDLYTTAGGFLKDILLGTEKALDGISHYRRSSSDADAWEKSEQFWPERQPVFFEGPKRAALGDKAVINIVGEAGMHYVLKLYKIDDCAWREQKEAIIVDEGRILFQGVLDKKTRHLNGISYFKALLGFDASYTEGWYLYELCCAYGDTAEWRKLSPEKVPQPGVETKPVLELTACYPAVSGLVLAGMQDVKAIGWGLSEE